MICFSLSIRQDPQCLNQLSGFIKLPTFADHFLPYVLHPSG